MAEKKPSKQTKPHAPEKKESPVKTPERSESAAKREEARAESKNDVAETTSKMMSRPVMIGGLAAIILLAFLGFLFGKWFIVAKVNGEAITRQEYTKELEKAAGKQVMESLATKKLIEQEAKKKNIKVDSKEIDAEIKKIEAQLKAQGQSLDQVLAFQGLTRDGLREQISIQKMVEKLVGNDVKVTDAEVEKYIEENKDLATADTDLDTVKAQARERLKQQKTDGKIQQMIQDIRKKAKIEFFNEK